MQIHRLTILLTAFLALAGCRKDQVELFQHDAATFYPVDTGYRWVYQFDSLEFRGSGFETDTFSFEQRHEVVQLLYDSAAERQYRIEIHNRVGNQWQFDRNYFLTVRPTEIIRTDQDYNEVVLSMPFVRFKTWNGNQYSNRPATEYYLDRLFEKDTIENQIFDSTVAVINEIEVNLINSLKGEEVFAKHYGPIYRERDRRTDILNISSTKGYLVTLKLIRLEK